MAEKLGKPQTFVSKSELGERRLDFLETVDFCAACGVPIADLVARLEKTGSETHPQERAKRKSPRKMDSEGRVAET